MIVPEELKERLENARSIAVFAGAGVSTASGIPTFRGAGQMSYFEGLPPIYLYSTLCLQRNSSLTYRFLSYLRTIYAEARPNLAHRILAAWQREALRRRYVKFYLLTTNVDGLLEQAGAIACELHGRIDRNICSNCGGIGSGDTCSCGGKIRPDVVLLGEHVPEKAYEGAITATRGCELYFAIGTSGVQSHSMGLVQLVKARPRATIIEINERPSYLTSHCHYVLRGKAEEILAEFGYGNRFL
ncbi:MAG: Sir2 family NAD-dependent protein deacetylase [Acidobacteriota bacterium]|nr:hypothetical protein [Blastocatellia bacterium]MDW8412018.1 Sir2 family NAD-dependent protein deacetylase [Acidobacteriota bacterium]